MGLEEVFFSSRTVILLYFFLLKTKQNALFPDLMGTKMMAYTPPPWDARCRRTPTAQNVNAG